ncbi:hypothetical protein [Streptomyces sp. MP131-18]|uniref:hypothetical protein n=1 Tax=Streptomyces sp. MP131-18 TaxID=1857892 RepID=UPI00097C4DDC|nr:hypothetical protein [Streptomyces sp. MP131-18]ONK15999.1 hypothetical protein STBA_68490 [Streptomyces sp. MP131-18]
MDVSDLRWVLVPNGDEATTRNSIMDPLGLDFSRSHLPRTGRLDAGGHALLFGGAPGWPAVAVILTITEPPSWI